MPQESPLGAPLRFQPVYQTVVWGGERLKGLPRKGVPEGPVGEAWELADHPRGQSVVESGEFKGHRLADLCSQHGEALVGRGYTGGPFPLMVKLIDASQRLSVQVHPSDALARAMGLADGGKDECWWVLKDGGELFVGVQEGVDAQTFESARAAGRLAEVLQRVEVRRGDFVHLPAGTVHAIGAGCLLVEIQQTSDNTFRVDDWGRVGLDGAPRPLHLEQAWKALDLSLRPTVRTALEAERPRGLLVDGPSFTVEELRLGHRSHSIHRELDGACAVVVALEKPLVIGTTHGLLELPASSTALVPAAAGEMLLRGAGGVLIARPGLKKAA